MIKKYDIFYNDGAEYGTMTLKGKTQEEIESAIQEEIDNNNRNNPNPMYHITRDNFKIKFMNSRERCLHCGDRLKQINAGFCSNRCKEIYNNQ